MSVEHVSIPEDDRHPPHAHAMVSDRHTVEDGAAEDHKLLVWDDGATPEPAFAFKTIGELLLKWSETAYVDHSDGDIWYDAGSERLRIKLPGGKVGTINITLD